MAFWIFVLIWGVIAIVLTNLCIKAWPSNDNEPWVQGQYLSPFCSVNLNRWVSEELVTLTKMLASILDLQTHTPERKDGSRLLRSFQLNWWQSLPFGNDIKTELSLSKMASVFVILVETVFIFELCALNPRAFLCSSGPYKGGGNQILALPCLAIAHRIMYTVCDEFQFFRFQHKKSRVRKVVFLKAYTLSSWCVGPRSLPRLPVS